MKTEISKEEANKLIAEFMGLTWDEHDEAWTDTKYAKYDLLKYSTSWDWLMPVVEKIESLGYDVEINGGYCIVRTLIPNGPARLKNIKSFNGKKIIATYQSVVQFILWYNKQTR